MTRPLSLDGVFVTWEPYPCGDRWFVEVTEKGEGTAPSRNGWGTQRHHIRYVVAEHPHEWLSALRGVWALTRSFAKLDEWVLNTVEGAHYCGFSSTAERNHLQRRPA